MEAGGTGRVRAPDAALAAIERLRARHGPLVFVQSGGCCDGSSPICLSEGEILLGPYDLLVGEVAGCPFYVDREQYARWNEPSLRDRRRRGRRRHVLARGVDGLHFVARSPSNAAAEDGSRDDPRDAPLPIPDIIGGLCRIARAPERGGLRSRTEVEAS